MPRPQAGDARKVCTLPWLARILLLLGVEVVANCSFSVTAGRASRAQAHRAQ